MASDKQRPKPACPRCGATELQYIKCKLICTKCKSIILTCCE